MKTKLTLIVALTLTTIVSVFCCMSANADSILPWNVDVIVENNGTTFHYNLAENIEKECDCESRAFYCGSQTKLKIIEYLKSLEFTDEEIGEYVFPGFNNLLKTFSGVYRKKKDAIVTFDGKFHYNQGQDGIAIDTTKLLTLLAQSTGKQQKLSLPLVVDKAVTTSELKANTVLRGTFTTSFSQSGAERCNNIATASKKLCGTCIHPSETFSFNKVVGKRSEENGYKTAKIILDGNYTDGIGGGVCQVSTTLYNAVLLADLPVAEVHSHSLVSSYIMAGFDAMVSYGSADLKFINNTNHNIYIGAKVENKKVTFSIYGQPNEYKIVRENTEVREKFATQEVCDEKLYPELIYTTDTKVVTNGSDGVKSKSYLNYYKNGKLVERKLIRTNSYKRVDKVVAHGSKIKEE